MGWTLELLQRLNEHGVPYVIIGGVAAIAHGSSRVTEDIDICSPLDHASAVRIISALQATQPKWRMRPDLPIITPTDQNLVGLKNMYIRTNAGQIDILGELEGVGPFEEVLRRSIGVSIRGVPCRVVDLDALISAKEAAGREKDKPVLHELRIMQSKRLPGIPPKSP